MFTPFWVHQHFVIYQTTLTQMHLLIPCVCLSLNLIHYPVFLLWYHYFPLTFLVFYFAHSYFVWFSNCHSSPFCDVTDFTDQTSVMFRPLTDCLTNYKEMHTEWMNIYLEVGEIYTCGRYSWRVILLHRVEPFAMWIPIVLGTYPACLITYYIVLIKPEEFAIVAQELLLSCTTQYCIASLPQILFDSCEVAYTG